MQSLPNKSGSFSTSFLSSQNRHFGQIDEDLSSSQDIVKLANSISMVDLFKIYHIFLDSTNKTNCPFSFHKERTPSFTYYPDTNSFWCFGCKTGSKPIDLVSNIENCSFIDAAQKIIKLNLTYSENLEVDKFKKLPYLLDFSEFIRNCYSVDFEEENFLLIEELSQTFDILYQKYDLDNNEEGLKSLIFKIKEKLIERKK